MSTRNYIILLVILCVCSFAGGRYLTPPKVTIQEKIVTKEVVVVKHTDTVVIKKPDGTVITTTKEDSTTKEDTKVKDSITIDTRRSKINISALAGTGFPLSPVYGIAANKELIGPVTVGIWGLSNLTAGISLGLNF